MPVGGQILTCQVLPYHESLLFDTSAFRDDLTESTKPTAAPTLLVGNLGGIPVPVQDASSSWAWGDGFAARLFKLCAHLQSDHSSGLLATRQIDFFVLLLYTKQSYALLLRILLCSAWSGLEQLAWRDSTRDLPTCGSCRTSKVKSQVITNRQS